MARRTLGQVGASLAAALLIAGPAAAVPPLKISPQVATKAGPVVGSWEDDLLVFRGVPYAAPPVGPLRWRPPQPHAIWKAPRDAKVFGYDCVQTPFVGDGTPSIHTQSEDCLTLNIWQPSASKTPLPVMVWIHGGGYTNGIGTSPVFDGVALARAGVVVVTLNYRLGRFGFFAHPALTADHPDEPKGNYGFMDQIAALQWVRENIGRFGGDPAKVTIFGESAGGGSVNMLLASPAARGLFAHAIAESGGLGDTWPCLADAEPKGLAFAKARNVEGADAAALRALPLEVVKGDLSMGMARPETYPGPMVDGKIVPRPLPIAFAEGKTAPVPYLVGANSQELGAPSPALAARTETIVARYPADQQASFRAAYGDELAGHLASEVSFVAPARMLAGQQAKAAPTFLYRFGVVPAGKRVMSPGAGARHASELAYVFGTLPAYLGPTDAADAKASETIRAYWTNFAKTGDPNGAGLAAWPRYEAKSDQVMMLTADGAKAGPHPNAARLDVVAKATRPVCPAP